MLVKQMASSPGYDAYGKEHTYALVSTTFPREFFDRAMTWKWISEHCSEIHDLFSSGANTSSSLTNLELLLTLSLWQRAQALMRALVHSRGFDHIITRKKSGTEEKPAIQSSAEGESLKTMYRQNPLFWALFVLCYEIRAPLLDPYEHKDSEALGLDVDMLFSFARELHL